MKKLISIAATLAIAMSMITLPIKATEDYSWWHMDESAANSDTNSGPAVTDFAGKGSGYTYAFTGAKTHIWLTSSFADSSKRLQLPENYTSYEGYMLISMNVCSPAGQQFQFQVKDSYPITPNVTVTTANGFNINRWNKVFAVVKLSATRANRTGYYYINGEKKSWTSNSHYLFDDTTTFNTIRLRTQKDNTPLYVDDLHVAFTTDALTDDQLDELAAMPTLTTLSGSTVTAGSVDNVTGVVTVASGTTLADLQSKNTNKLTAYDSTLTTPVTSSAALADGDIVIATDSLGKMSYFDVDVVGDDYSWWHMDESAVNGGANSAPAINDFAGKGSGYTYGFTGNGTWIDLTASFADSSKKLTVPENYTSYEGYMLISMNVYSPMGQQFQFRTNYDQFNAVTPTVTVTEANGFNINRWNKIFAVVKLSATQVNRKGYYYINGVKKSWNNGHYLFSSDNVKNIYLRTLINNTPMYVDDVYVTFTTDALTDDQLGALAAMPTLAGTSDAYVTGNTVNALKNTKLSDLQTVNTNTLTAYTDSTFATTVAAGTALADGNMIISTDAFGKMSYYDVDVYDVTYFDDERTVDYSAKYTSGQKFTYGTNVEDYLFTVVDDSDSNYGETFFLLDVKNSTSSKYFVITQKAYVKLPVKASDNANYFDPSIETNNGTDYSSKADRHHRSPIYFLNDGDYFKNAWDSMTKLDSTVPVRLSDEIRSHIDTDHLWTCEPAPNALIPNAQYSFAAGIVLPSASEIRTYADRFLVEEDAELATETGNWRYIFTRTMLNNSGAKRFVGYVKGTNELKGQDISDSAVYPYIRPCFWLDDTFFASVKVDLSTAGDAVKQEIKKLGYNSLKDTYSMDELIELGVEIPDNTISLTASVRNGGEAAYGKTLELECNYYSTSGYKPDSAEINWKRNTGGTVVTVGQDLTYVITEADADTGTSKIYCEITYTDSNGTKNTKRSNEFTIPSLGVASVNPNAEWSMNANSDAANKFTVDGKSFTLIDTFDNDKSTFFVTANDNYGTHQVTSAYMNAEDDESYVYWMNTAFRLSGNFVDEDYVALPEDILSYIDYDHIWLTEAAPNNPVASKHEVMMGNYSFEAGLAPLSASELKRYKDVIGSTEDIGDTGKFNTRTAANWANSSKPNSEYMLVSEFKLNGETEKVKMNHWELPSGTYIRPAFYLTKEFFKNVEISFDDLGDNVIEAMKNTYYIEDLEDVYDSDNLEDAGFESRPEEQVVESETLLDLGGSVEIIYSEISDSAENEVPIFAVYNANDTIGGITYGGEAGFGSTSLTSGQKAKAMLWDDSFRPIGKLIEVNYGEDLNVANTASFTSSVRGNNFIKGESAIINVKTNGDFFSYKIKDFYGNTVKEFDNVAQLKIYQPIDVSSLESGYYEISIYSTPSSNSPIAKTSLSMLDAHEFSPADNSPFGMNLHTSSPKTGWHYGLVKECYSIGAMTVRDGRQWSDVEKTKGVYKYSFPCADLINSRNMDYIIVTGYNNPYYDNGETPYTDAGRAGFANYSKALYDLYPQSKGGLTNMEVYNEFWRDEDFSAYGGPHKHYYWLAKMVYQTVKRSHPEAVLFGEFGTEEWNQNIVNDGIVNYMDAAAIHLYPGGPNNNGRRTDIPENSNMKTKYNSAKTLIEGKGKTARIWVTETGMNTATNGYYNFTELEQAIFLPRTHFQLLELGAEKVLWYDLLDEGNSINHEDHYGLLRAKNSDYGTYTPKPAYVAYGVMTRVLDGTSYGNVSKSGTKYCYTFEGNNKKVSCVYDTNGASTVTVTSSAAFTVTNLMGHKVTVPAGTHTLDIGTSVLYLTGDVTVSF